MVFESMRRTANRNAVSIRYSTMIGSCEYPRWLWYEFPSPKKWFAFMGISHQYTWRVVYPPAWSFFLPLLKFESNVTMDHSKKVLVWNFKILQSIIFGGTRLYPFGYLSQSQYLLQNSASPSLRLHSPTELGTLDPWRNARTKHDQLHVMFESLAGGFNYVMFLENGVYMGIPTKMIENGY